LLAKVCQPKLCKGTAILIWGLREYFRQKDAADALDHLRAAEESLWERARTGSCSINDCGVESRQLQNAIFDRRSNSPMIFSWIYNLQRISLEQRMSRSAEDMIGEIKVQ
jgi:hypothetical protein